MSETVTLNLSKEIYDRAELWASRAGTSVSTVLSEAVNRSLFPLSGPVEPIEKLSDQEVLALADSTMTKAQDEQLSVLLLAQQDRTLTPTEAAELDQLMQVYQEGLLRKAEALAESVARGLREPIGG